jgi:hypothetical protein
MSFDPAIWEGDGLPEDDEDALDFIGALELFDFEIEALIHVCKREAYVHEKVAKYENKEWNLTFARFAWRRVERWTALLKLYEEQQEEEPQV